MGDKFEIVNFLVDPFDCGYGGVSRPRNMTLMMCKTKVAITHPPEDMYRRIATHLNRKQTRIADMFIEPPESAVGKHELESLLEKSRARDKTASTFKAFRLCFEHALY